MYLTENFKAFTELCYANLKKSVSMLICWYILYIFHKEVLYKALGLIKILKL